MNANGSLRLECGHDITRRRVVRQAICDTCHPEEYAAAVARAGKQ